MEKASQKGKKKKRLFSVIRLVTSLGYSLLMCKVHELGLDGL